VGVTLGVGVRGAEREGVREGDREGENETLTVQLSEALGENEGFAVNVRLTDGDNEVDGDRDNEGETEGDAVFLVLPEGDRVDVVDEEKPVDEDLLVEAVRDKVGEEEKESQEGVPRGETLEERVNAVAVMKTECELERVEVGDALEDSQEVGGAVEVVLPLDESEGDRDTSPTVIEADAVNDGEGETDLETNAELEGEEDTEEQMEAELERDGLLVEVEQRDDETVVEEHLEAEGERVTEAQGELVELRLGDLLELGELVDMAEEVGLRVADREAEEEREGLTETEDLGETVPGPLERVGETVEVVDREEEAELDFETLGEGEVQGDTVALSVREGERETEGLGDGLTVSWRRIEGEEWMEFEKDAVKVATERVDRVLREACVEEVAEGDGEEDKRSESEEEVVGDMDSDALRERVVEKEWGVDCEEHGLTDGCAEMLFELEDDGSGDPEVEGDFEALSLREELEDCDGEIEE